MLIGTCLRDVCCVCGGGWWWVQVQWSSSGFCWGCLSAHVCCVGGGGCKCSGRAADFGGGWVAVCAWKSCWSLDRQPEGHFLSMHRQALPGALCCPVIMACGGVVSIAGLSHLKQRAAPAFSYMPGSRARFCTRAKEPQFIARSRLPGRAPPVERFGYHHIVCRRQNHHARG